MHKPIETTTYVVYDEEGLERARSSDHRQAFRAAIRYEAATHKPFTLCREDKTITFMQKVG